VKIEIMNIDELIPYANNAKEHPDSQINQIAGSIAEFGFNDPIAIDEHYCDVIIERYCQFTDNYDIKINGKNINWKKFRINNE